MKRTYIRLTFITLFVLIIAACGDAENNTSSKSTEPTEDTKNETVSEKKQPELDKEVIDSDTDNDNTIDPVESENPVPESEINVGNSRVPYISSVAILNAMPQVQRADQELQQFAQGLDQELRRQQQIMQQKYAEYMKDTAVSQSILETRQQELNQMQQRIMQLQQSSEKELAARKEKLYAPILKKVDNAIKKVAKERGYTHVLDITAGSVVYADESTNITKLVMNELGLQ